MANGLLPISSNAFSRINVQIFQMHVLKTFVRLIKISLKFAPMVPIVCQKSVLVQEMACCLTKNRPLPEPIVTPIYDAIYDITRPQWVEWINYEISSADSGQERLQITPDLLTVTYLNYFVAAFPWYSVLPRLFMVPVQTPILRIFRQVTHSFNVKKFTCGKHNLTCPPMAGRGKIMLPMGK